MARGSFAAQIGLADLVNVERHEIHRGIMVSAVPAISIQKAIHNVLRVRIFVIDRSDGSDFRTFCRAHAKTKYSQL
jgi:hypothetical protein